MSQNPSDVDLTVDPFSESRISIIDSHFVTLPRPRQVSLLFRAKYLSLSWIAPSNYDITRFHLHFIRISLSSRSKRSDLCRGHRDHARVSPALHAHRTDADSLARCGTNSPLPSSFVLAELIIALSDICASDAGISCEDTYYFADIGYCRYTQLDAWLDDNAASPLKGTE